MAVFYYKDFVAVVYKFPTATSAILHFLIKRFFTTYFFRASYKMA